MAAAWGPHLLTNLSMWMDASDVSTITQSGGSVSKWVDKTIALPFTQATAANQPAFVSNAYNGLPAIRFASDDFFSFPRPHNGLGSTFIVYYTTDSQYLHYNSDSNVTHSIAVMSGANTTYTYSGSLGGDNGIYYNGKAASWANRDVAWNQLNTGAVRLLEHTQMSLASTTATMEWNGYDTGWAMVGDICEIIFTAGYVSTDDRQKIEGYLAHKWGFKSSLDFFHPYSQAAPFVASLTGTVRDKDNQPAIRKIYAIDETTDKLISTNNSLADGTFNIPFNSQNPITLVITGEPNRAPLVYNGLIPQ